MKIPFEVTPESFLGKVELEEKAVSVAPIPGASWYSVQEIGDGLCFRFPQGTLAEALYLTADLLLEGKHLAVFVLTLQEGENGPAFGLSFGLLNHCQARMRMPLEAVQQNRWLYDREGAWLKPRCQGERVDLSKVDRMYLAVSFKSSQPVSWWMTPISAVKEKPPRLEQPLLPKGVLIDELGQSTLHEWPEKSQSAEEVITRLRVQAEAAPKQRLPESFTKWGGWKDKRLTLPGESKVAGFFHTRRDNQRWWLVDPDGYAFWSTGLDCVRVDAEAAYSGLETALAWLPDAQGPYAPIFHQSRNLKMINYLGANFIRAFGEQDWYERWATIALAELRRLGFNTVANWSDWQIASRAGTPYVRPLDSRSFSLPMVYRDFPDVFHPDFSQAAAAFAEPLRATKDDPAFIGYFLMNEPTWGFASITPAEGMLFNTSSCHTRLALADFLKERYPSDAALAAAWELPVTLAAVRAGDWKAPLSLAARSDLEAFSAIMVERYFAGLSKACKTVDPHHLNLGIRYYTVPPQWAIAGMRHFDVFSMNCYRQRLPAEEMEQISAMLDMPILIGEWHFGALDVGLPASGIGHAPTQMDRGKAYRVYIEDAAAKPWCVGAHYFTLYDQSALGRFDGENYNIGFLDICNRPYEPLAQAARSSHERLYAVAASQVAPYNDAPEYLPLLFM